MKTQIETAFSNCLDNNCLETRTEERFWINDFEENPKCEICLLKDEKNHFEVENLTQKEIHFLAVDHCIFDDSDSEKCDFAIFDDKSFCWIEIKTGKSKNRAKKRDKAIQQLENTISKFKQKLDFKKLKLEAIVCSHSAYTARPFLTASKSAKAVTFIKKFNVRLQEGRKKKFE